MKFFDFSQQDLNATNFTNQQNLNGSSFFKGTLNGVSLAQRKLRGTNFEEAVQINVDPSLAMFALP